MKIAVIGATGNVGRQILNTLAERNFPATEVIALASRNSTGQQVSYGEKSILNVQSVDKYDFKDTKIAFFAATDDVSRIYAKKATNEGCVVIDNSSYFRLYEDIPLIIPEINGRNIDMYKNRNIISSPDASVIQLALALKPINDLFSAKRVIVSTYQATSGLGREAMNELFSHTKKIYENDFLQPVKFKKQIPFNVLPQVNEAVENDLYKDEFNLIEETKKLFGKNLKINTTCVQVPVFNCHSQSVNVECNYKIDLEELLELYEEGNNTMVLDNYKDYVYATPKECSLEDCLYLSRLRIDNSVENGLNFWSVLDNMRKGSALNSVQIAELLL